MDTVKNVSSELKNYFNSNAFFRSILRLDSVFAFGGIGIMVIQYFISLGGVGSAIAYYGFLLGVLLAFANQNHISVYIPLFAYAVINAIDFIKDLVQPLPYTNLYSIITCALFGFIAFSAYKYSLKK
jgi:hypothetical protein